MSLSARGEGKTFGLADSTSRDSLNAATVMRRLDSLTTVEQNLEIRLAEVEAEIAALMRNLELVGSATGRFRRTDGPIFLIAALTLWLAVRYLRRRE